MSAPAGVSSVEIRITDAAGQVVRQMSVPASGGVAQFTWDGQRDNNTAAASGEYAIEAIGRIGTTSESLPILMSARVSSVSIDASGAGLMLNTATLGSVPMTYVRRVM